MLPTDGGQVLENQLCALRLASTLKTKELSLEVTQEEEEGVRVQLTRLATDHDALILLKATHMTVAVVSDRKNVWRQLSNLPLLVHLDLIGRVDGEDLVRVDCDQD